jgi:sporulation integral membrane protein YtvI
LTSVSGWATKFLSNTINILTRIPTIIVYLVITILSLYFICTDKIYILDLAEHHMPRSWVKKVGKHVREISHSLGGYLKAQITLIFVSFIILLVGLYIFMFLGLNIRYPLLIALITAFIDALPILGSGTVLIPWAIISALDGDFNLGISIISLWIIMCVVRQLIEPKLVSNKIGIHPIFTLLAMYTGFKLLGLIGMLLGPIALIIIKSIFSTLIEQGVIKTLLDKN